MTAPQQAPTPARQYRLATFGTTALVGPDGDTVLGTHGRHCRRLALMSVLAAAGDRGRSRDHLFLLFWPDVTQSRARHSLDQLLYALRGSLGECVFASVNPVRLDPDVVSSDVAVFAAALDRGDVDGATAVYRGPFLDGFHLPDAPEFARWVDAERSRLTGSYSTALERMARKAEVAGDLSAAVHWWRKLTELDPVSSRSAAHLIGAMTRSGDHVAALRYAERFEAMVAQELGTSAGPAFAALVSDVRAAATAELVNAPGEAVSPVAISSVGVQPTRSASDRPPNDHHSPGPARRRRWAAAIIGAVAVVLTSVLIARTAPVGGASGERLTRRAPYGPTRNIAAYELYLRGSDPAATRGDSATRAGLEYFRQAIAIDSEYAAAYAGFARLMLTRVSYFEDTTMSRRDGLAAAEQAASKAILLDSTLAEAHGALAVVRWTRLEVAGSEAEIRRAVALDPTNTTFREWLVQQYVWTGRPAEALAEARRAVALDPLSPNATAELAHALLANDRCDEALALLARLRSLQPPLLRAGDFAARCYARKRMWGEAIAEAQRGAPRAGLRRQGLLGFLFARAGRTDEARRVLAVVLDRARRTEGHAFDVATIYAGLGAREEAFSWLDKALEERAMVLDNLDMVLDALAPDPRIDVVRQRLGLPVRTPPSA